MSLAEERRLAAGLALVMLLIIGGANVFAQNGFPESSARNDIVPGKFLVDPPTLENLGFRWYVNGDKNRNATVEVSYRAKGEEDWRAAQPMLRIRHEMVDRTYRTGNLFAGSVMFLEPGTEYEVQFTMKDPDGGAPAEPKMVSVATRGEAEAWEGGRTLNVKPGERIFAAYEQAQPGDIIMLLPGVHELRETCVLRKSGEPGKPIVFRGAGAEKTIVQGLPGYNMDFFCLVGVSDIIFEDLTIRRGGTAILTALNHITQADNPFAYDPDWAGPGASNITVRRCRIEDVINGIWTCSKNSRNWTIMDNVLIGANKKWFPFESHEDAISFVGVKVYGQGHVVCYNRINYFLGLLTGVDAEGPDPNDLERFPVNIDFYNNELFYGIGDCVQTDYMAHNIRVYRNICVNADGGLSAQPIYGGPVYMIRNVVYGITRNHLKWNNHPAGIIAVNNTVGSSFYTVPHSNCHLRNNLFFGGTNSTTLTPELHTMDYDGFMGNSFTWAHGDVAKVTHTSLAKFTQATGYEQHGIIITVDDFVNAAQQETGRTYTQADFDFNLKPLSKAVDSGLMMVNINEDFLGEGPDRGAFELGAPPPHYGPRTEAK